MTVIGELALVGFAGAILYFAYILFRPLIEQSRRETLLEEAQTEALERVLLKKGFITEETPKAKKGISKVKEEAEKELEK